MKTDNCNNVHTVSKRVTALLQTAAAKGKAEAVKARLASIEEE